MNISEAESILNTATREELVDHAFGDAEVYWYKDGTEIASGYFGQIAEVQFTNAGAVFKGFDAGKLRNCGQLTLSERNDSGGNAE